MCGILAVLHYYDDAINKDLLVRMRDTMYHRGPDDAGIYVDGSVGLAHRRLSIIDLSETGHQPMSNEDGSVISVCNGEIYNYIELRKELKKKGHLFHSTSDSEVIIHQYEESGEDCLEKLQGMFGFIIWDKRRNQLFAARDRLGIKPLYYFATEKRVVLSSEIKGIIEDRSVPREPSYAAVADYFFAGRALAGKSMFKNIREIEPGHLIIVDKRNRRLTMRKYWDVVYDYNYGRTKDAVEEELFSLLDDAVRVHCRSDVPVGCHLSGGLDTSTIVGLAARHRRGLKTFSIKFSDEYDIDETRYAKAVAKHVGAEYYESSPTAVDMSEMLPFLVWHMDIPMATDGGFGYYTVSRLARQSVTVSLTGHGGDEIFAGYPAQFMAAYGRTDMFDSRNLCSNRGKSLIWKKRLNRLLRGNFRAVYNGVKNRLYKEAKTLEDRWVQLHCGPSINDADIFCREFLERLHGYNPRDDYIEPFERVGKIAVLDKCLYHDMGVYLPGLLHQEDRASMAVSLESRVPLLDHKIVEFLATVPPEQKVAGLVPKYLLRKIASFVIPEEVFSRRDKFPFPVPGKFWSELSLKSRMEQILLSRDSLRRRIIKPGILKEACQRKNTELPLWNLLNLELWFRIFIDRNFDVPTRSGSPFFPVKESID